MPLRQLTIPPAVAVMRERQPQANIPQTYAERSRLKALIAAYVAETAPVPPLSFEELRDHSGEIVARHGIDPAYADYIAVVVNNESWREQLAQVPYERRLLLLPKCLRVEEHCPAPFDELGLLCKRCGLCSIQDLQDEAERLGYAVLVAEGSALVIALLQSGKIDAIVGVSCLSVLERAFPHTEAAAVASIAIPLLQDDCADCTVDIDHVWDAIHLTSEDRTRRLDLDALRDQVRSWFSPGALAVVLGCEEPSVTERIAFDWLARAGKRWRPFLAACAYEALAGDGAGPLPDLLKMVAIAVECFHKASLIHDDIEDADLERYGAAALHVERGVPVALNAGDLLVGEGYRLIAACGAPSGVVARMIAAACSGHRRLCVGQGEELSWAGAPEPLKAAQVLAIFRDKTAPAFEVSLALGALLAGAGDETLAALARYSEALGIAYQIRDDVEDFFGAGPAAGRDDLAAARPTLPMAIAWEKAGQDRERRLLASAWRRNGADPAAVRQLVADLGVEERCRRLLEAYKQEAIEALKSIASPSLKGLLRRVVGKIFTIEISGWCGEFEARNAAARAAGSQVLEGASR